MHPVVVEDIAMIIDRVGPAWERLAHKELLLTGYAGFLGYYFVACLARVNDTVLKGKECRLIGVDNLVRGKPAWLEEFAQRADFSLVDASVLTPVGDLLGLAGWSGSVRFIVHAASIASPTYYRKHPIETMDANVGGLRNILEYVVGQRQTPVPAESLLFFSSSEVYGDPSPDSIPTPESYWGRVSFTGPRACYDESKRYGETLCVNFYRVHGVPVKIARPFNNFGPGLNIDDRRVIPDLMRNVLSGQDLVLHSDGSPTRTFCYVADAVTGYWQLLLSDQNGESFNIGTDGPEISIRELAELVLRVAREEYDIHCKAEYRQSDETNYLTDNPNRRCPNIQKARQLIAYNPRMGLEEGIRRTMRWYHDQAGQT
ncbi:MAG: NAD-dependent epimerase/dehydratase family protein [Chloroflexi bacterium]|nr:NAD-dependent epimerase/dehydratase family protein [Chloroflexota bacterium]